MSGSIYITNADREKLLKLIKEITKTNALDKTVLKLKDEIDNATVIDSRKISRHFITMNSKALIRLNDEDVEVSLVYPEDADLDEMKLSVLSPIGTAIIGYKEGSSVEWDVPSGKSTIEIKKILYQPEAAGNYELQDVSAGTK